MEKEKGNHKQNPRRIWEVYESSEHLGLDWERWGRFDSLGNRAPGKGSESVGRGRAPYGQVVLPRCC